MATIAATTTISRARRKRSCLMEGVSPSRFTGMGSDLA
jgi:hypothetical protein